MAVHRFNLINLRRTSKTPHNDATLSARFSLRRFRNVTVRAPVDSTCQLWRTQTHAHVRRQKPNSPTIKRLVCRTTLFRATHWALIFLNHNIYVFCDFSHRLNIKAVMMLLVISLPRDVINLILFSDICGVCFSLCQSTKSCLCIWTPNLSFSHKRVSEA